MSNRAILLGAAGLAFLYFLTRSVIDLNRLLFQIAGFRNLTAANGNVSLTIDVLISNPTKSAFPLYNTVIDADILVNNFALGKTGAQVNALLVPGQQIVVPLTVSLGAANVAGGVAALLSALQTGGTRINVLGTCTVAGVPMPINITYNY